MIAYAVLPRAAANSRNLFLMDTVDMLPAYLGMYLGMRSAYHLYDDLVHCVVLFTLIALQCSFSFSSGKQMVLLVEREFPSPNNVCM